MLKQNMNLNDNCQETDQNFRANIQRKIYQYIASLKQKKKNHFPLPVSRHGSSEYIDSIAQCHDEVTPLRMHQNDIIVARA